MFVCLSTAMRLRNRSTFACRPGKMHAYMFELYMYMYVYNIMNMNMFYMFEYKCGQNRLVLKVKYKKKKTKMRREASSEVLVLHPLLDEMKLLTFMFLDLDIYFKRQYLSGTLIGTNETGIRSVR